MSSLPIPYRNCYQSTLQYREGREKLPRPYLDYNSPRAIRARSARMCLQSAAWEQCRHDWQSQRVSPSLRETVYVLPPSALNEVRTALNVVTI
jgi:hypothetical protein